MRRRILFTLLGLAIISGIGAAAFVLVKLYLVYITWAVSIFPPFGWRSFALVLGPIVVPALLYFAHEVGAALAAEDGRLELWAEGQAWWWHDHARWTRVCILFEHISRWAWDRRHAALAAEEGKHG